jgi:hypothetical protein
VPLPLVKVLTSITIICDLFAYINYKNRHKDITRYLKFVKYVRRTPIKFES